MIKNNIFATFFICLAFLGISESMGATCVKLPCTAEIQYGSSAVQEAIKASYVKLNLAIDNLVPKYTKQLELLKAQNELLEKYKAGVKEGTIQSRELVFLLEKFNRKESNVISEKASKKE